MVVCCERFIITGLGRWGPNGCPPHCAHCNLPSMETVASGASTYIHTYMKRKNAAVKFSRACALGAGSADNMQPACKLPSSITCKVQHELRCSLFLWPRPNWLCTVVQKLMSDWSYVCMYVCRGPTHNSLHGKGGRCERNGEGNHSVRIFPTL